MEESNAPLQPPTNISPQLVPGPNPPQQKSKLRLTKNSLIIFAIFLPAIAAAAAVLTLHLSTSKKVASTTSATPKVLQQQPATAAQTNLPGLQLVPNKNYGNKYASGTLPVGDGKYSSTEAKTVYIYVCGGYANNMQNAQGGAGRRGPWFNGTTSYNINQKSQVHGSITWQSRFSDVVSGNTRVITSNGLPNHVTGVFPIQASDAAFAYDKNPNAIKAQSLTYNLNANPSYGTPQCESGQVGIMLSGAALFNGFDAAGRDAGAWEVQDGCSGHPEKTGLYHYHTLSSCIKDVSVSTVIGFALDGFPITGPQVGTNNYLTSSDLDECHGITSNIDFSGKKITMYHYVMTQDFPYSVSCYRSTPIQPPGQGQAQPPTRQ